MLLKNHMPTFFCTIVLEGASRKRHLEYFTHTFMHSDDVLHVSQVGLFLWYLLKFLPNVPDNRGMKGIIGRTGLLRWIRRIPIFREAGTRVALDEEFIGYEAFSRQRQNKTAENKDNKDRTSFRG